MRYDYRCKACDHRFEVVASLKEKEAGLSPACPSCGSAQTARLFGRVTFLRTGRGVGETADGGEGPAAGSFDEAGYAGGAEGAGYSELDEGGELDDLDDL